MTNQYNLNEDQIEMLEIITSGGRDNFAQGYDYIYDIIKDIPEISPETTFWFENAIAINRNDVTSPANLFIRSVTSYGLQWDGVAQYNIQGISNTIGESVIGDIISREAVPSIDQILSFDISAAIQAAGQTIGGWGGAFYYWDAVADLNTGQTVGDLILSTPGEYEKFVAVNAAALDAVYGEFIATASLYGDFGTLTTVLEGLAGATLPPSVSVDIVNRAVEIGSGESYAGNPNFIDGYLYLEGEGWVKVTPSGGYLPAPSDKISLLDARRNLRLEKMDESQFQTAEPDVCFTGDVLIDMADGTKKPIRDVKVGDEVMSFEVLPDGSPGKLVPGRVTQTFINHNQQVLDFHGTGVTPGHVYLTEGGQYKAIMDILLEDGIVFDRDGRALRAATNCSVGSREDLFVCLAYRATEDNPSRTHDGRDNGSEMSDSMALARVRAGTLLIQPDGTAVRLLDLLEEEDYTLLANGLVQKEGEPPRPLLWGGPPPRPEDYILARSGLTLEELYEEGSLREDPLPQPRAPIAMEPASTQSEPTPLLAASRPFPGGLPQGVSAEAGDFSVPGNRKARRKQKAVQRRKAGQSVH